MTSEKDQQRITKLEDEVNGLWTVLAVVGFAALVFWVTR